MATGLLHLHNLLRWIILVLLIVSIVKAYTGWQSKKEFAEELPVEEFISEAGSSDFKTGRRDFLKFLGFGVAAATLASCEAPVIKSIPYVNKPEDITPGVAVSYFSDFDNRAFPGIDLGVKLSDKIRLDRKSTRLNSSHIDR
jgi:molybdopterin-containing oxidoreductase family iron-sulfur binding subunit